MSTSIYLNTAGAGTSPSGTPTGVFTRPNYEQRDGFDLIWRQEYLQNQITEIEKGIREIEKNTNLSDTEKMYSMQMAMNTWSAVTNLRTNMMKIGRAHV